MPPGICTWQFNFQFDVDVDESEEISIELLRTVGINFEAQKTHGIDRDLFGEHMFTGGNIRVSQVRTCIEQRN